jgi:hypothetical protein
MASQERNSSSNSFLGERRAGVDLIWKQTLAFLRGASHGAGLLILGMDSPGGDLAITRCCKMENSHKDKPFAPSIIALYCLVSSKSKSVSQLPYSRFFIQTLRNVN